MFCSFLLRSSIYAGQVGATQGSLFVRSISGCARRSPDLSGRRLVGTPRLELGTSSLSEKRSNRLSYVPSSDMTAHFRHVF